MEVPSHRALGATGLGVTTVTYGAMGFDGPDPREDERRIEVIHAALAAGIGSIDTAPLYGFGRSESVIARALRGVSPRPLVLTKVGLRWDDTHGEPLFTTKGARGETIVVRCDSRPESVLLEIERSLARLEVGRLDLVQVHQRDRSVPIAETMGALRDAVRSGAVRAVGVSNFSAADIAEAQRALGDVPLASLQSLYSLLERDVERDGLRGARAHGIGFLAYSPLAQGLLGGGWGPERPLPPDWRRDQPLFTVRSRRAIAKAIDDVVRPIARRHDATPAQIALAWVIAQRGVSTAITGASSPAQIRETARAMAITLSADETASLERAFREAKVDRASGLRARARALVRRVLG